MEEHQPPNKKGKTIFLIFEKKKKFDVDQHSVTTSVFDFQTPTPQVDPSREFDIERDPGLRKQICEYHVNQRDEIRRAYINAGPYQPKLSEYPKSVFGKQNRRFQYIWFKQFPWLEYSPSKDKAYCFPCFLFDQSNKSTSRSSLIDEGFSNWKRVTHGEKCAFLLHVGLAFSSHSHCVNCLDTLKRSSQHIDKVMNAQSKEEILRNRKRVKGTIETVLIIAFQGLGFRGHDESSSSLNQGNFIELLKFKAKGNELENLILDKAPKNAKYSSPKIQKEILHILANRVRKMICEEVGGGNYCILVDESQDESRKEQMALVLRYVKHDGSLNERFFDVVGVENTSAITLKNEISDILARYNLPIQNMRGQGYDGASNMRGEWNGLQALFLKECPYAYYIHCFAHRLQLALVAAAKDEPNVWQFFSHLTCIVNLISYSPKRVSELKSAQRSEVDSMLASGERQSGKGANQIGNLQRAGASRWSSHYESVKSMIDMYSASCVVVENLKKSGPNQHIRGQALGVFKVMRSFDFIFILQLMDKIMGITDTLCQSLQRKSQDVVNAMKLVSTTKTLLQQFREDGWDNFLANVVSFCNWHTISIANMSSIYEEGTSRRCQQRDQITIEHHYHFDVFNTTIDYQLMELKHRFDDVVVELLSLSAALDPSDSFRSFNEDKICMLAAKFYPHDFTAQDVRVLRSQLMHYKLDVVCDPEFQKISSLPDLCQELVVTRKFEDYSMLDKLIRLVLVLPVSTASTERAFSCMKHVKTTIRSSMGDEFLADCMLLNLERDLGLKINLESVIDEFESLKTRRAQLT